MIIKRLMANLIDVIFSFSALVGGFMFAHPILIGWVGNPTVSAGILLIVIAALVLGVQYPFMLINQTIGKAFFGLKIVSTNDGRPLTPGVILQRELFAKVFTAYILCIPVLLGKAGEHEIATETKVV